MTPLGGAGSGGAKLCWFFAHGKCTKGDACSFAHGPEEPAAASAASPAQRQQRGTRQDRRRDQAGAAAAARPPVPAAQSPTAAHPEAPAASAEAQAAAHLAQAAMQHAQAAAALWGMASLAQAAWPDAAGALLAQGALPCGGCLASAAPGLAPGYEAAPPEAPGAASPWGAPGAARAPAPLPGDPLRLQLTDWLDLGPPPPRRHDPPPPPPRRPGEVEEAVKFADPSPASLPSTPDPSPRCLSSADGAVKFADPSPTSLPSTGGPPSAGSAPSEDGSPDADSGSEAQGSLVVKNTFLTIEASESPMRALRSVKTAPGNLDVLGKEELTGSEADLDEAPAAFAHPSDRRQRSA